MRPAHTAQEDRYGCFDRRFARKSGIPARLRSADVPIEQQEMVAGDYRIGVTLIERKSAIDLAVSIMDGRRFGQAEAINAAAERSMLLCAVCASSAQLPRRDCRSTRA